MYCWLLLCCLGNNWNLNRSDVNSKSKNLLSFLGRIVFPATGCICLVWRTFAGMKQKSPESINVVMKNVKLLGIIHIPEGGTTYISVSLQVNGNFEVTPTTIWWRLLFRFDYSLLQVIEDGLVVVTGHIELFEDCESEMVQGMFDHNSGDQNDLPIYENDAYRELRFRGYHYRYVMRKQSVQKSLVGI